MIWHRRPAAQGWLARLLAFAFVVSGGLTIVGSPAGTIGHTPASGGGAHSVPFEPIGLGAVGVAEAVSSSVVTNSSRTLQHPEAGDATWLLLPRPTAEGVETTWVPAVDGVPAGSSAYSRAPPPA